MGDDCIYLPASPAWGRVSSQVDAGCLHVPYVGGPPAGLMRTNIDNIETMKVMATVKLL